MSIRQLLDPLLQELSLSLRTQRLRGNSLDFDIRHRVHDDGREDILEAADDMAFNDLSGDVGDESLLRNLHDWC